MWQKIVWKWSKIGKSITRYCHVSQTPIIISNDWRRYERCEELQIRSGKTRFIFMMPKMTDSRRSFMFCSSGEVLLSAALKCETSNNNLYKARLARGWCSAWPCCRGCWPPWPRSPPCPPPAWWRARAATAAVTRRSSRQPPVQCANITAASRVTNVHCLWAGPEWSDPE